MQGDTTGESKVTRLAILLGDATSPSGIHQLLGTCWYLGAVLDRISSITIFSESKDPPILDNSMVSEFDAEVVDAFRRVMAIAEWQRAPMSRAGGQLRRLEVDHLVIGESRDAAGAARLRPDDGRNDVYADFLTERGAASKLAYLANTIHFEDELIDLSTTSLVLDRIRQEVIGRPAAVFGTGPSLDLVNWIDFENHVNILCNSTVGNPQILEAASPVLIAAADPVFHSSFGTYAIRFRRELASALASTDAWFVCPTRDAPLYRHYLPPSAAERVLAVPLSPRSDFNLDLCSVLEVKSTANVLTLLLLPLACTFSRSVNIAGCDGKPTSSDYFWNHSRQVQFDDELEATKQPFSGFFDIDYDEYYDEHLTMLTAQIEQADTQRISVINTTPSHIPVLQRITHPSALHVGKADRVPDDPTLGPFDRSQQVFVDGLLAVYDMAALTWPTGLGVDSDSTVLVKRTELELGPIDGAPAEVSISRSTADNGDEITVVGPVPMPSATTSVVLTWFPATVPGETRFLYAATVGNRELPVTDDAVTLRSEYVFRSDDDAKRFLGAVAEQASRSVRPPS